MSTQVVAPRTTGVLGAARGTALLASGLLAGAVVAVWLVHGPLGAAPEVYVGYRQAADPPLTRALPPLGGLALLAALATAVLTRGSRPLVLGAVACLTGAMVLTVAVHLPINDAIAGWSAAAPPADWEQLRDRWALAHTGRTALSVAAFVLLVLAGSRTLGGPGQRS